MRGHSPITLGPFKGLWQRGDPDNVPLDHLADCNNIQFAGNDLITRYGVGISQSVGVPLKDIKRIYNYPTQTANTLIVLIKSAIDGLGKIYHVIDAATVYGPILSIVLMEDFTFVPYAGRAYISPFKTFQTGDINIQKGLTGEKLYVYKGDGTNARAAAGTAPAGNMAIANGAAGYTDAGLHIFGIIGETDSGYLSQPTALESFTTVAGQSVSFGTLPVFTGAQWVKRHIVASVVIPSFDGNLEGQPLFFIPLATINDNTTLFINNVSFYDQDLLEDASHLFDNFQEIPAGCKLWLYHDRLCLSTTFNDISIVLVSHKGEPEAISQTDGIIIVPLDGNPITNGTELRDICYVYKRSRTVAFIDNGEAPSSWPMTSIDNTLGTTVHGIATVLDSGTTNVDYLFICTFAGISLFNGKYINPELSYKIQYLWTQQDRNLFHKIQIINAPIQKWLLIILPDGRVLVGDYSNGIDWKNIRWFTWSFLMVVNTIAIWNIDEIIFGSELTTELQS